MILRKKVANYSVTDAYRMVLFGYTMNSDQRGELEEKPLDPFYDPDTTATLIAQVRKKFKSDDSFLHLGTHTLVDALAKIQLPPEINLSPEQVKEKLTGLVQELTQINPRDVTIDGIKQTIQQFDPPNLYYTPILHLFQYAELATKDHHSWENFSSAYTKDRAPWFLALAISLARASQTICESSPE